jgi:hypothetical protein
MKNLFLLCLLVIGLTVGKAEKNYTDFVTDLSNKIKQAPFKHSSYDRLAIITDTYGPRMWGSMALEQCIY